MEVSLPIYAVINQFWAVINTGLGSDKIHFEGGWWRITESRLASSIKVYILALEALEVG